MRNFTITSITDGFQVDQDGIARDYPYNELIIQVNDTDTTTLELFNKRTKVIDYYMYTDVDNIDVNGTTSWADAETLEAALEPVIFSDGGGGGGGQVNSLTNGNATTANNSDPVNPSVDLGGAATGAYTPIGTFAAPMGYTELNLSDGLFGANIASASPSGFGGFIDISTTSDQTTFGFVGFNAFPSVAGDTGIVQFAAGANSAGNYFGIPFDIGTGEVRILAYEGVANGNQSGISAAGDNVSIGVLDNTSTPLKNITLDGDSNAPITVTNTSGYGQAYSNRLVDEANVTTADKNHKPSWGFIEDNFVVDTKLKYAPSFKLLNIDNGNPSSGTCYALKVVPDADITLTELEYYVANSNVGRTVYVGVYSEDGNTLIVEGSGNADASGLNFASVTPTDLTGGEPYWFAILEGNGAPTFGTQTVFSNNGDLSKALFVSNTPTGLPVNLTGFFPSTTGFYIAAKA